MGSEKTDLRQPRLSLFLIAVLAIIAVSILSIHSAHIPPPAPEFLAKTAAQTNQGSSVYSLLPISLEFNQDGPPETYRPESLFEKIDGKAPLYLESGFTELRSQRFANTSNRQLWFEMYLYDMTNNINAFSVFSTQRRPDTTRSALLANFPNYLTENAVFLQAERFYIECIGSSASEQLLKAMIKSIRSFLTENGLTAITIPELSLFPQQGLNPDSLKLYLANTFGSEVLTNTFIGEYVVDNLPVTAYLSSQKNNILATNVADSYFRFLVDSGGSVLEEENKAIRYIDLYGSIESVFHVGTYAGGVHEAENLQGARTVSESLYKALQEQLRP